jgi:hypothetical protein
MFFVFGFIALVILIVGIAWLFRGGRGGRPEDIFMRRRKR